MKGEIYFRGRKITPSSKGKTFTQVFHSTAENLLPDIFPSMKTMHITQSDLAQLLNPDLSGISTKFITKGEGERLGIFHLEDNRYVPSCGGEVPNQIARLIQSKGGIVGGLLIDEFASPPYGYEYRLILACVAGLLRAGRIYISDYEVTEDIHNFHG